MAEATKAKKATEFKGKYHYANGKRKSSISRVRLYENGKGQIVVNGQDVKDYFFGEHVGIVKSPLKLTSNLKTFDISIQVTGGGVSSQADSCRHGIAKALTEFDPELRSVLKPEGHLTRDSRTKERKKYGLKKARRAPQFSKR